MESPRKGTGWANQIDKPDYLIELDTMPRACVYGVFSTYGHETVNNSNSNNNIILLWFCHPGCSGHHITHLFGVPCHSLSLSFSPI